MQLLSDYDYALPPELIAQTPPAERGASRLLVVEPSQPLRDALFSNLLDLLRPFDLLIVNDTKVMKARLLGQKPTGGAMEILVERLISPSAAWCMVRASRAPKVGERFAICEPSFDPLGMVSVAERDERLFLLHTDGAHWHDWMTAAGQLPLPPYIEHTPTADDDLRYQTVFAEKIGAVAAPTAGLHFTDTMLQALRDKGVAQSAVTLHVGAGTFAPVKVEDLDEHHMHREYFDIPEATVTAIAHARAHGGRVIAVGTTSLRALESAVVNGSPVAGAAETALFIRPGYRFQVVDALITNFHLPKSTLLMLVSAFAGFDAIRAAYQHAIAQQYRFFSYGDAMFLVRA